jgi:predicted nucleotidyltransferase
VQVEHSVSKRRLQPRRISKKTEESCRRSSTARITNIKNLVLLATPHCQAKLKIPGRQVRDFGPISSALAGTTFSAPETRISPWSARSYGADRRRFVPKTGTILPEMGTTTIPSTSGLADALFTPVQQRVLGLLFGQPSRRFQSAELIQLAESGTGAAHRQLQRLAESGLVTVTRVGNQKHYQANAESPIFAELRGLIVKTVGIVDPLRKALEPLADRIVVAFVYGPVAKGTDTAKSDVDLMVVSDSLHYPDLYEALQAAEAELARPVNPTVVTLESLRKQRQQADSFVSRLLAQSRLSVLGTEDDLN